MILLDFQTKLLIKFKKLKKFNVFDIDYSLISPPEGSPARLTLPFSPLFSKFFDWASNSDSFLKPFPKSLKIPTVKEKIAKNNRVPINPLIIG